MDVIQGRDTVMPVSFGLLEDTDTIKFSDEEQAFLTLLKNSCVLMDYYQPIHWCNKMITKLHKIGCNSIGPLCGAIANG